jgi:predicted permease
MRWWRKKDELDEEIAAHLRMAAAERIERGENAANAEQEARREFGNIALVKDVAREAWGWVWLERLMQDLRYALRQMRKSPAFAATVIATLASGIAAPAAMFTVVDRVMLRPLPYKDADRLVDISTVHLQPRNGAPTPYLDIAEWRKWSKSFDGIAFYTNTMGMGRNFLEGKSSTEEVSLWHTSANLFSVLGVAPQLGRDFRNDTDGFAQSADADAVVLSDAIWHSMFGADPKVIGKTIRISGEPYIVTGVMPRGFSFPFSGATSNQAWTFVQFGVKDKSRSNETPNYSVIARLKRGVSSTSAEAELTALQKQVSIGYADPEARLDHSRVHVESHADGLVESDTKRALLTLLAASGVLWLIACVNSTNLMLARAMTRQREIAMRGALGAGCWRILQQFVVEGLLLSLCSSVLGLGLALLTIKVFTHGLKTHLPFLDSFSPDIRVLAALMGLTVLSALLFTLWPAWMSAHAPIEPALKQGGIQSGSARGQNRLRNALVTVEIALSLTLLVGCGLLLRTIYALRHVPLGFRTDHIIVANLEIPGYKFKGENIAQNLYLPLVERVRHVPGVQAAGLMTEVPLGNTFNVMLYLQSDKVGKGPSKPIAAKLTAASPDVQKVFGFKMLAGRFFTAQDTPSTQAVFVVNRAFARLYLPDQQDPSKVVGMKLWQLEKNKPAEIIGILDDIRQQSIQHSSQPEIEASITQITPQSGVYQPLATVAMDIAIRTNRDPKAIIREIREVLRQADPALAGSNFTTMEQVVEDSYGNQRLAAHLLEIFGGSALLLCIAGLYGLLAYIVSQRTRELGVRLALGAQRGDLMWLVLRQACAMLVTGVAMGTALALASGRIVRSYLYGVSARDGWTLASVALVLFLCGLLAAWLPARRAAMVDPMEALRAE